MRILRNVLWLAFTLSVVARVGADNIDWWTVTGGGGISRHGATAIGGAIGPIAPALSEATGGDNVLSAAFWSVLTDHPQIASPVLRINLLAGQKVVVSWPVAVTGFVLEYTTDLNSGLWGVDTTEVVDSLTDHTVTVAPEGEFRCYRLRSE